MNLERPLELTTSAQNAQERHTFGRQCTTDLFRDIWANDVIHSIWIQGLILKLLKNGDLQNGDNLRGITLLSVPSKIFCRVLLHIIEGAIDVKLRQEQAGFRRGQ